MACYLVGIRRRTWSVNTQVGCGLWTMVLKGQNQNRCTNIFRSSSCFCSVANRLKQFIWRVLEFFLFFPLIGLRSVSYLSTILTESKWLKRRKNDISVLLHCMLLKCFLAVIAALNLAWVSCNNHNTLGFKDYPPFNTADFLRICELGWVSLVTDFVFPVSIISLLTGLNCYLYANSTLWCQQVSSR